MSEVAILVRRADQLQGQLESIRNELDQLRQQIARLQPDKPHEDCLLVALRLATDLGSEFNSEKPHDLAGRGENWFPS